MQVEVMASQYMAFRLLCLLKGSSITDTSDSEIVGVADIPVCTSPKSLSPPRLLPVSTKCLNDDVKIAQSCVTENPSLHSPRQVYASRVRRSLTLTRQPASGQLLPDIPLGRHRR